MITDSLQRPSLLKTSEPKISFFVLPIKLSSSVAYLLKKDYLSFILVQDILIASLNAFITFMEIDNYRGKETFVYLLLLLPSLQITMSTLTLLMRNEYLKNNTYLQRMRSFNYIRW